MVLKTFFSGLALDRAAQLRTDTAALEQAWREPQTRIVAVWRSQCMVRDNTAVLLSPAVLAPGAQVADSIYLGQLEGQHFFAFSLDESPEQHGLDTGTFASFRSMMGNLSGTDAALLAYAKGMVEWRQRHRHCSVCGAPNRMERGGFSAACTNPGCNQQSFPRIDPAIIVLATADDRCLLGRQKEWPADRFSTIAGFVEPGESLEDAVARELREEANIEISSAQYKGSQPWPFPGAIMLGFRATARTRTIAFNDGELADARWFSREEMASVPIALPPVTSIAFRLIEDWFDEWNGPRLRSLNLSSDFARTS